MMRIRLFVLLLIIFSANIYAQTDTIPKKTIKYTPEFKFKEGVFLSFENVKNNSPIPKARLISSTSHSDIDFFKKLIEFEKIIYYDEFGLEQEAVTTEVWGFSKKGMLYICHNEEFNRIPVIGSICHFVADETIYQERYDPYRNPYNNTYSSMSPTHTSVSKELRQYLLDFETGKISDYDAQHLEVILMRDPIVYDEFNALKKKKKKQLKFFYIRKFNKNNPIYFPAN